MQQDLSLQLFKDFPTNPLFSLLDYFYKQIIYFHWFTLFYTLYSFTAAE